MRDLEKAAAKAVSSGLQMVLARVVQLVRRSAPEMVAAKAVSSDLPLALELAAE